MTSRAAWTPVLLTCLLALTGCKSEPPPPPPAPSCECGERICGKVCENVCGACPDDGVCSDDGLSCRAALPIGSPCATDIDCGAGRLCLKSGAVNVPNGYCSDRCGGVEECPDGSVCQLLSDGTSRCLAQCTIDKDCRSGEGYLCDPEGYCQACVGSCSGKICGDDGCGNPCGDAAPMMPVCDNDSQVCTGGQCAPGFSEVGKLFGGPDGSTKLYWGWWDGAAFDFKGLSLLVGGREVAIQPNANETRGVDRLALYDHTKNTVTLLSYKLPKPIARPQAAFVGDSLFVAGGITDPAASGVPEEPLYEVYKLNDNNVWVPQGTLPEATSEGALVELGGRLYLIGGMANGTVTTRVDVADPVGSTLTWNQPGAPQRTLARTQFTAVSDGTRIWVIGGWDGTKPLATVETFEPNEGWKRVQDLPAAVVDSRAAVHNGRIYVFGGRNGPASVNDPLGFVQTIDVKSRRTAIIGRTPQYLAGQVPVVLRDGTFLLFGGFEFGISGPVEHPEVVQFVPPNP